MAVTQEQIDALNAAIASGERQISNGSQQVTYRPISDLIKARDDLQTQFDQQNGVQRPKQYRMYHAGKGY